MDVGNPALFLGRASAGLSLVYGMGLGVWKWRAMTTRPDHRAPMYVDIAHRASFLYAAAATVLADLAATSVWPAAVNGVAMGAALSFFWITLGTYTFHAWRGSARTMFAERNFVTGAGMVFLILAEVGGAITLLSGWGWGHLR